MEYFGSAYFRKWYLNRDFNEGKEIVICNSGEYYIYNTVLQNMVTLNLYALLLAYSWFIQILLDHGSER